MAKIRRKIQRVQRSGYHTFDEELWPVNVALVVLAGFVAGAIIAVSRFDDPRFFHNGWFRITSLALTTGALIWAASKLPTRSFRRTMQFATVLAILAHLVLIGALYNQRIAYQREQMAEAEVTVLEAPVTLPEYHEQETPQEFEQPVETEAPEEVEQTPVEREESQQETPQQNQPTPEPGKTPEVAPTPIEKVEVAEAAPRRTEDQSQLSKQTSKAEPRPQEAVAAPQEQIRTEQQPDLKPEVRPIERVTQAQPDAARPTEQPPAQVPIQRQVTEIARRDLPETQPTATPSMPTLNRSLNEPREVPHVQAEAPQPVAVNPAAKSNALKPNSVEIAREASTPDVAQQMAAEPKAAAAPQPAQMDAAQPQTATPQLARSPDASPQKAVSEAQLPATEAASAPEAVVQATTPGASPAPSQTDLARTAAQAPELTEAKAAGEATNTPPATIAGASLARAEQADAPSMTPQAAVGAAPARAAQAADVPASPMNVESPSIAVAEQARPEATPTRSALSKGTAGIAGIGRDVNFDHGEMAARSPAPVPSASANRAQASQTEPVGPALSPSAPALVAKSVAGANVPQSTLAAQDVTAGNVAGASVPSNLEASSSAAVVRADASAPTGKITGAAGKTEFDIGPTQIVANAGSGRPGGGGAPEIRLDKQSHQFSRQPSGGNPLAAIATGTVAEVPAAPAATGGGAPAPALGSNVPTLAKSSAGGTMAQAGAVDTPASGGSTASVNQVSIARAASGQQGAPGPASAGGVAMPQRSVGQVAAADATAEQVQLSAGPAVGAASPGTGVSAPADLTVKSSAGLPGRAAMQPMGAVAGDVPIDAAVGGAPGVGIARRAGEAANEPAPTVAATGAPGLKRNSQVAGVPQGQIAMIAAPELEAAPSATGSGLAGDLQPTLPGTTGTAPRSSAALPVQVAALEGPGGLALALTPDVGSISRQARRDSAIIHPGTARFLSREVGGPLAVDGRAREPAEAFSRRRGRQIDPSGEYGQPSERTEKAVELGLEFLARHQSADGRWSLHNYGLGRPGYENETSQLHSDTAATGLALLAFLGAGYDHYDDAYASQIRQALEFLLKNQKSDGDLFLPMDAESNKSVWLYSHGIAAIALCEAYGMTGDVNLREPAQRAIDFIVAAQNKSRGGWRYVPGRDSDTSVSGWQLMALKSGELAGLKVPQETYSRIDKWLDTAQSTANDQTMYAYNPFAPIQTAPGRFADHGRRPTPATTSMGLLMRLYTGWNRNDPRMVSGCDYLLQNPPQMGTSQEPLRDSYYWYYSTQLMFHMKGDYWKQWNDRLHPLLVDQQLTTGPLAGSWDPRRPVADRWGVLGGRIYVTTLNLLSLEVYYRHLPIYEDTAK